MAKVLNIFLGLVVSVLLSGFFYWLGWNWAINLIGALFFIFAVAILFSPRSIPVPFSREANEKLDAYNTYCWAKQKKPKQMEYNRDKWIAELPYPVDVVAAFGNAMRADRISKYAS